MGLPEVHRAAEALRDAEDNRTRAMATALEEGETVADIARAARVTRQTVYRLTRKTCDHPGRTDREVLDAGLEALLELDLPENAWSEVMRGRSHADLLVKARRMRLGIRNAPPRPGEMLSQELQDGLIVAGRLLTGRS